MVENFKVNDRKKIMILTMRFAKIKKFYWTAAEENLKMKRKRKGKRIL